MDRSRKISLFGVAALVGLLAVGCSGKGKTDTGAGSDTTAAGGAKAVDPATAATISGKVMFTGAVPVMKKIKMGADPKCAEMHKGEEVTEFSTVVNPDSTLRWVFVYVKSGLEGVNYPVPTEKKTLDQRTCLYNPHVWGMMAGQDLEIINSDETLHNVHALPKGQGNEAFNLAMPFKGQTFTKKFVTSEVMIPVKCEVHPWMHAYIGVLPHPIHSTTGEDGSFKLNPLPPGTYTVEAWHEEYGAQEQTVTVGPSETKEITFTFAPKANP